MQFYLKSPITPVRAALCGCPLCGCPPQNLHPFNQKIPNFDPHNYSADDGFTGTWSLYKAAEPITEAEYREAFENAIEHPEVVLH